MLQESIESRFIFNKGNLDVNYIADGEGQTLGFNKLSNGSNVVFTKDLEGVEVAIEHCVDGTKVFHMSKDSKGLPAMHEIQPDGTEFIYLFDQERRLEKMIEFKSNGDKVTYWFSPEGDIVTQEQRQKGGILFKMITHEAGESLIWLHTDGSVEAYGDESIARHLQKIFAKFLDGVELNLQELPKEEVKEDDEKTDAVEG